MYIKIFLLSFLLFAAFGCSDDPCETDANSIDCPTGDTDSDGVINSEDEAPEDKCIPNLPVITSVMVGTWNWTGPAGGGKVKINDDGTYEDIASELVSNGTLVMRSWSKVGNEIIFEVENSQGLNASLTLPLKNYDCDKFTLDASIFGEIIFTRV